MSEVATERKISEDLSREIDESIDAVIAEVKGSRDIPKGSEKPTEDTSGDKAEDKKIPSEKDLPDDETPEDDISGEKGEDESDDADEPDEGDDDDDKDAVTDDLLERAVRLGVKMSEARSYPNAALLESMCDRLEAAQGAKDDAGDDKDKPDKKDDDLLAKIPDLDPEDYDENVINGFKALKEIVRQQSEQIKELRTVGEKSEQKTFFESKVSGLDKEYAEALKDDSKRHEALRKQYEVLAAGYKATGEDVSQDDIFDQAVAVVLGDVKTTIK